MLQVFYGKYSYEPTLFITKQMTNVLKGHLKKISYSKFKDKNYKNFLISRKLIKIINCSSSGKLVLLGSYQTKTKLE